MENTIDTVDRISLLPAFIAHKILSNLLDSPEAVVRMSVLSKDWFALTASFPMLDFSKHKILKVLLRRKDFKGDDNYTRNVLLKNVAYTTFRFCKQNVSANTLTIDIDLSKPGDVEIIEDCLESVLKRGMRALKMDIRYDEKTPMLRLPNILLSASALSSLTIHQCKLPSSLMVDGVKFKSLKLLSLSFIQIDEGVIENLTTSCPLLEEIYLEDCDVTTFCVYMHHTLRKVQIFCKSRLDRMDIEAPNLRYFHLVTVTDEAPSMNMASCNKLTTFYYQGAPLKSFTDFLSSFPFMENLSLGLTSPCNHMKLSNHSLRRFEFYSECDLEEIDINTPNLLLFEYYGKLGRSRYTPFRLEESSQSKGCMKWYPHDESVDTLWFQKLRRFLDWSNVFKVLKLILEPGSIDVEELKEVKSPPYVLEHIELEVRPKHRSSRSPPILEAVLWCCRPRSLTLNLIMYSDKCQVVQRTYETLLQQENKSRTNIRFVLSDFWKGQKHFNDLNLVLKALSLDKRTNVITFIKEEVVQEAG